MQEIDQEKVLKKIQEPSVETKISKSKDGNCIIIKTIITKIFSRKYFEKVLENKEISK